MSDFTLHDDKEKQDQSFDWKVIGLLLIVILHYTLFYSSFLWALRHYEYSNKMIWVEESRKFYQDLILYKNSVEDSNHPNGRFRAWIVQDPISKDILVQDQFSNIKLSHPTFLNQRYEFDYILKDPTFYVSNHYSILQKRSQMRWIIKGTLINEAEKTTTRIYFDQRHPNHPILKTAAKNKKNLYVFVVVVGFITGLIFSLAYLKASILGLKQEKYSDFVVAILGLGAVMYFLFYKMIWLWLQIEF